jgi:mono/diheme cytochrome c family protein
MIVCWVFAGCASETDAMESEARTRERRPTVSAREPARPELCARDRDDAVRDVFCAATPPVVRSLEDLQQALALDPDQGDAGYESAVAKATSGASVVSNIVTVLGHSTALSGHLVSSINPRVIILGDSSLMAFQRGVQKVEVITPARNAPTLNFYLFEFEQACNRSKDGCMPGDLYTARLERDWLAVTVEDDEDLKNTPQDCRQCHQRQREVPTLLMRELNNPWTHFFEPILEELEPVVRPGVRGSDLMADYRQAKGDERYGNFALEQLAPISPFLLETVVGIAQPVFFDAPRIQNERWPYDPETHYGDAPRPSPTWEAGWEAFKRGEQLALPYLEPRATDPDKLAQLSETYARYRAGEISEDELPSLADIFPDDPALRARIGLQNEPDASPVDTLIQACGSCHNDVLDQEISRARFNVNLWQLDPAEIEVAIERIERAPSEHGVMPPPEARQLDPAARERLLDYLRSDPLAQAPDERLVRAAELGMAGGSRPKATTRR